VHGEKRSTNHVPVSPVVQNDVALSVQSSQPHEVTHEQAQPDNKIAGDVPTDELSDMSIDSIEIDIEDLEDAGLIDYVSPNVGVSDTALGSVAGTGSNESHVTRTGQLI